MKRFIKNLFIRIFKRKEYRDSIEVINKLLGIEEKKHYRYCQNSSCPSCCQNCCCDLSIRPEICFHSDE